MTFRTICVAVLLSSLPLAGCGTVTNVVRTNPEDGGKSTFGGVRRDMACIQKASNGELGFRSHAGPDADRYPQVALMAFCAIDLPFSLIGDIVTWPYAVVYSAVNRPIPTPPIPIANLPAMSVSPQPGTPPMPLPNIPQAPTDVRPPVSPLDVMPRPTKLP